MADLTLAQRFGSNVSFDEANKTVTLDLNDLTDAGDIADSLGLDISGMTTANADSYSTKIMYALLLLAIQQQPTDGINDPELKMFLSEGGLRIGTGARTGQMQRVISVNIYTVESNLNTLVDADNI